MDLELEFYDSDMSRSGSIACLSKQTISNAFECILSCIVLLSFIYILLLIIGLSSVSVINTLFYTIGYISLVVIISAPIGLYGSSRSNYYALFLFFIITSYHLYSLIMYFWLNIRSSAIQIFPPDAAASAKGHETLHHITTATLTSLIALSLLFASLKIISTVHQIEPARVIVVDNNPLD